MKPDEYDFPAAKDGFRGMLFVRRAVESCRDGSVWLRL
jgi:hypothetical protein